jgi:hypothetical protein
MFLGPNLANVLRFKNIGNILFFSFLVQMWVNVFKKLKIGDIFLKKGIILPHNIIPF